MREGLTLLVSRVLLATIFIHEAVWLALNFDGAAPAMAKLGVPPALLAATAALQLGAGLAILVGWQLRIGAAALGLFCLATATMFHTNFASRNELLQFEKDLAIAGGMFALMIQGGGHWALDAVLRARRSSPAATAGHSV